MIKTPTFLLESQVTSVSHQAKLIIGQASSPHPVFKTYHHHLSTH